MLDLSKTHRSGWTAPPQRVPIAKLKLNIYKSDKPLGNIGVRKKFLSAHQRGNFYSRVSARATAPKLVFGISIPTR